jgi:hypothetical protein
MGLLAPIMVELEKPENETKLIAFEYALEFKRDHPFIAQLGQSLGMSETQIDTLFIQANTLKMAKHTSMSPCPWASITADRCSSRIIAFWD